MFQYFEKSKCYKISGNNTNVCPRLIYKKKLTNYFNKKTPCYIKNHVSSSLRAPGLLPRRCPSGRGWPPPLPRLPPRCRRPAVEQAMPPPPPARLPPPKHWQSGGLPPPRAPPAAAARTSSPSLPAAWGFGPRRSPTPPPSCLCGLSHGRSTTS
jgi:hypothetical protein